jgi:hypothetical protein
MEIKRKVLLGILERVMPVISSKSAVEYQNLNFYENRLQATNGSIWVDTETGFSLNVQVRAEPFYLLVKKLKAKDLNLDLRDSMLYISTTKSEGEFSVTESAPAKIPTLDNQIEIKDAPGFIEGLRFCRLGVSKDETTGPLCGVAIKNNQMWGCDRYRILRWILDEPTNITTCAPAKLADILHSFKEDIQTISYAPGENGGGCFGISLEGGTSIWAAGIEGEYKDLSSFFPDSEAEVITLGDSFPDALERHLANLKDVKGEDKEMTLIVKDDVVETVSQKVVARDGQVERKLNEDVDLDPSRSGAEIKFCVNPILMNDVVGLSLSFKYFSEENAVLFETEKFRYMIMARG